MTKKVWSFVRHWLTTSSDNKHSSHEQLPKSWQWLANPRASLLRLCNVCVCMCVCLLIRSWLDTFEWKCVGVHFKHKFSSFIKKANDLNGFTFQSSALLFPHICVSSLATYNTQVCNTCFILCFVWIPVPVIPTITFLYFCYQYRPVFIPMPKYIEM